MEKLFARFALTKGQNSISYKSDTLLAFFSFGLPSGSWRGNRPSSPELEEILQTTGGFLYYEVRG
jgi:hypothetical protein